jgi:hypothetical protein
MLGNFLSFPALATLAFIHIVGCDRQASGAFAGLEPAARPTTETFRDFGEYVVHFNAITTDQLSAEHAREYGIVRSPSRALLTVSVLRNQGESLPAAVHSELTVSAVNLSGQYRSMPMREVSEGTAIYYLGEVPVTHMETLIFNIGVRPAGETEDLSVRYLKQFFMP